MPAAGRKEVITNARGTQFVAVTKGDEWNNWVETADGFTVGKHVDGNWYYVAKYDGQVPVLGATPAEAPPPAHLGKDASPTLSKGPGAFRGAARSGPAAGPVGPFVGPVLFLLAEFSDQAGSTSEASWASFVSGQIADYYNEVSHGAVTLMPAAESFGTANNGVVGWLNLGYPHPNTGSNFGDPNQQIAGNAILAADPYVNFASFDANADGYVDSNELAVVVIVAGYERSYSANYGPSVWGHRWSIYCCGGAPTVDGVTVGSFHGDGGYAEFGELHRSYELDGHQATMGIMVHELGHLIFGLPDLYDTDYSSNGIGAFSVMSGGSWGYKFDDAFIGMTPVGPDAWIKFDRGWATGAEGSGVESIIGSGSVPATATNTVFRVSTMVPTQYFLVENRQDTGYDRGLEGLLGGFGGGVAIWHVDETIAGNTDETHRKVDLEEADGTESYGETSDLWYVGNATSFNDLSTPATRLYDGSSSGKAVDVLTVSGDSMDVQFSIPLCGNGVVEPGEYCDAPDPGACPTGTCTVDCTCPDPVCGNDVVEAGEACDGTSDAACPGLCSPAGDPSECQCPDPDGCSGAWVVDPLPYTSMRDTSGATIAPTDPILTCGAGGQQAHSVWYTLVAPANGTITADTFGSNYDTVLAALTGSCGSLSPVPGACDDDNGGLQSQITFPVTGGSTYLLEVTSYSSSPGGALVLHVSFAPCGNGVLEPGEVCDDGNTLDGDCCSSTCGFPAACKAAGKSLLLLKNDPTDDAKDKLIWKWLRGEATVPGELGVPATTDYTLCCTPAGLSTLALPLDRSGGHREGLQQGCSAHRVVQTSFLKSGVTGRAKAGIKGHGANLPDALAGVLPLPVRVFLVNDSNSTCFESDFFTATNNDGTQFKARTP
jgi:M6 family metalloprotease-like protein